MSNDLQDFHNTVYLPISDGATNKLTKASSTNIYGGWANFDFRMDEYGTNKYLDTFSSLTRVNGSEFISGNGTVKAGNYYVEISFISAGSGSTLQVPITFDNIVAGFPETLYRVPPYASTMLCLIVNFTEDTRLKTNTASSSKMRELFIASYDSTSEPLRNFNNLKYLPHNETEDIMRYSAGLKYVVRPVGTAYPSLSLMNTDVNWASESGSKLPTTASDTLPWYHGYWRTYSCGQVNTGTTLLRVGVNRSRGGETLIQTGYFPEISSFGQEAYSSFYTYRLSDYTPYLPNNPTAVALGDVMLPSYRKAASKIVHTVATVNFWDNKYINNSYAIGDPFMSRIVILPNPELENWTWFEKPSAVLFCFYNNNLSDQRNHTLHYNNGNINTSVKIGYNHPTVLVNVNGNLNFRIDSEDGEELGKFYLSAVFLP